MRSVKKLFGFCILWVIILTFGANGTALAQVLEMKSSTKTTEENNTEKKTPSSEKVVNNVDAIAGNITKAIEKEQNPSSSQVQITAMDGTTDVVTEPKDPEEESFSLDYKDQKILKEKNKATIVSLEYVGDFSESERAILSNRLKHVLSNYYDLVSGDDKDIHHNLTTQIVKNGNTVQFTMNSKLPNGEFFEEILCENCDLKKQYASINELINRVVRNDSKMSSYDQLRIQDRLASNWQGNDRDLTWHITASSIAVISFWLS
ncbi:hypothetical protein KKA14_06285, partial [bacterium]|nr:hypothetical protein [bacterium]